MRRDADTQTYFLDFPTLFSILSRQKRSGQLWTNPTRVAPYRELISISLQIDTGILQNCWLMQGDSILLEGEQAYKIVMKLPPLEWYWRVYSASMQSTAPLPKTDPLPAEAHHNENRANPVRTQRAQGRYIQQNLSRQYMHVLSLCDGTRSVERIAVILRMPLPDLLHILNEFERAGLITYQF
jgi:hypothetical protein